MAVEIFVWGLSNTLAAELAIRWRDTGALKAGLQSAAQNDSLAAHGGDVRQDLDACARASTEPAPILRIDLIGRPKKCAVAALDDEDKGSSVAAPLKPDQFSQVACSPFADGVGETSGIGQGECDVFDLDVAAPLLAMQRKIEPAVSADPNLAPHRFVPRSSSIAPARIASAMSRFGRSVLIPIQVRPMRIISQV
jgi:hypothetical protein